MERSYDVERAWRARIRYLPEKVKVLFVAESPPNKGVDGEYRYFYFEGLPTGREFLYKETMKAIFGSEFSPDLEKSVFLKRFCQAGLFLLDAARCPVDKKYARRQRNSAIVSCAQTHLLPEIEELKPESLLLIKKNVFEILSPIFKQKGFKVLNKLPIPYPNYGHQEAFRRSLRESLAGTGVIKIGSSLRY